MSHHVFISYAHQDNIPAEGGAEDGWIARFEKALKSFLGGWFGDAPEIWIDFGLPGNAELSETLKKTLRESATLISVVSPRYLKSSWCKKELELFCQKNDIKVGNKLRIFKVLKANIPLNDTPAVFRELTGYEFFVVENGTPRILTPDFGGEYKNKFFLKVSDLAYAISELLNELENTPPNDELTIGQPAILPDDAAAKNDALYLALPPPDLWEQYENIKRDLLHRKIRVIPDSFTIPDAEKLEDFKKTTREYLRQCKLAVHLFDKESLAQADEQSYVGVQMRLAAERAADPKFSRLIWLGGELRGDEESVRDFTGRVIGSASSGGKVDVLPGALEAFKTALLDAITEKPSPVKIYVLYQNADSAAAKEIERKLFDYFDCEVLPSSDYLSLSGENAAAEIVAAHNDYLRDCDGVLIYRSSQSKIWARGKLSELENIGNGDDRQKEIRARAIYLDENLTDRDDFRTREAIVLKNEKDLSQFVRQLKRSGGQK